MRQTLDFIMAILQLIVSGGSSAVQILRFYRSLVRLTPSIGPKSEVLRMTRSLQVRLSVPLVLIPRVRFRRTCLRIHVAVPIPISLAMGRGPSARLHRMRSPFAARHSGHHFH